MRPARRARASKPSSRPRARAAQEDARRHPREMLESPQPPNTAPTLDKDGAGALPSLPTSLDRQLQRLKADRERLGGVNLQADDELEKINEQFPRPSTRNAPNVDHAIAKLRGAIGQLNREARGPPHPKPSTPSTATSSGCSRRCSPGGEARLEFIELVQDPLEGGLEIIRQAAGQEARHVYHCFRVASRR